MSAVKFIRERPADTDKLGSHSRVATALADVIRSQPAVRTIGLLGRWGSGKSTVINISQNALSKENLPDGRAVKFFIYDAWIHQSDPQRKSFLERLLSFSNEISIIDSRQYEDEIGKLTGSVDIHDIESTPRLSRWGIALAIALALVPIGLTLSRQDDWWKHIGNVLAFSPLAVLLASMFWSRHVSSTDRQSAKKAASTAALLFNKTVDKVRTRISKSAEPSTKEFQELFERIVLRAEESKILPVIVVDNLDRIPPEEAVVMWSSLKSLIDAQSMNDRLRSSFKILVPFDHSSIVSIFSNKNSSPDEGGGIEKAQSFLEKTFDANFIVGPPIDSDWREYLANTLGEAFGDSIDQKNVAKIVKVFECFAESDGYFSITPRRMNSYVNSLVSLWLQWGDQLSLASQAYYAARKLWDDPGLSDVLSSSATGSVLMGRLSSDWQIEVASIHFGVPPLKARQLVLEPELEKVSAAEDQERFSSLANIPGFARTLENWISKKKDEQLFSGIAPETLLNIASFSRASPELISEWEDIAAGLRDACSSVAPWEQGTSHARSGAEALRSGDFEPSGPLLRALGAKSQTRLPPGVWLDTVEAVLPSKNPDSQLNDISSPFEGSAYLSLLEEAAAREWHKHKPLLVAQLAPKEQIDVVQSNLADAVQGFDSKKLLAMLRSASAVDAKWNFAGVAEAIAQKVLANPDVDSNLIESILLFDEHAREQLISITDAGSLKALLVSATKGADARASAVAVYFLLVACRYRSWGLAAKITTADEWSIVKTFPIPDDQYPEFLAEFVEIQFSRSRFNENKECVVLRSLLSITSKYPSWRRFLGDLLREHIAKNTIGRRAYTEAMMGFASLMREVVGDEDTNKIQQMVSHYSTWEDNLEGFEDEAFWPMAQMRTAYDKEKTQKLNSAIQARLAALDAEYWSEFISSPPDYSRAMCIASAGKFKSDSRKALTNGIERWVTAYVAGDRDFSLSGESFSILFEQLTPQKRGLWAVALFNYFQRAPLEVAIGGLSRAAAALVSYGLNNPGDADSLSNAVIMRAIVSGREEIFQEISDEWPLVMKLLMAADPSIREDISQREAFINYVSNAQGVPRERILSDLIGDGGVAPVDGRYKQQA